MKKEITDLIEKYYNTGDTRSLINLGRKYGKMTVRTYILRHFKDAKCIVANEELRQQFPEDVRDKVYLAGDPIE
jgi:hypothetical protein